MIGQFFETMIAASSNKAWLFITHQNLICGNGLEPPQREQFGAIDLSCM